MRTALIPILALAFLQASCQSTPTAKASVPSARVSIDPAARAAMFSAVSSLEGRWEGVVPDGEPSYTVFEVTSGGSAIREFMAIDKPYEMTNMYTLDGDDLVLTHYCAIGNQPRMRAGGIKDGRIVFQFESVGDLKTDDQMYMGEMTLVIHDADHIEQQWRSFIAGEVTEEMAIEMKRTR